MTYFITFYTSTFIYYLPQFSFQFYLYVLVMGRTPFYRTMNELEHHFSNIERVHLLVIELEHPIFGFERSNIELQT